MDENATNNMYLNHGLPATSAAAAAGNPQANMEHQQQYFSAENVQRPSFSFPVPYSHHQQASWSSPYAHPQYSDTNKLLDQVMSIASTGHSLAESQARKSSLHGHRMMPALYSVLCQLKESSQLKETKIRNVQRQRDEEETRPDASSQLKRLDTMLAAEGIIGSSNQPSPSQSKSNGQDYDGKLAEIRKDYANLCAQHEEGNADFRKNVLTLLREQSQARPILQQDTEPMLRAVNRKFADLQVRLKQKTCEAVMVHKSRFLDARRKRRNFSRKSTEILNEYFYANLANPYPSDEVKEELARKCGITVGQISNWFGNKRIRYKKNAVKSQEEANRQAAMAAAAADQAQGMFLHP